MTTDLRNKLVDHLKREGAVVSVPVETALRKIPRELFATWLSPEEAYENRAVLNPATSKSDISTISQPFAVARFLEGFALEPGMNVLEIGAGTGYQAALIAHIVERSGNVITVDIAEPLIEKARQNLHNADINNVEVALGDGALGYPQNAPYDRIVATVGLREFPLAWTAQLKPEGRIVAPLHLGGEPQNHVLVSLKRKGDRLVGPGLESLNMVVLRGPHVSTQEQIERGPAWNGGLANELWVQVLPKDLSTEPTEAQKLIHRKDTTILVEVAQ